MNVRVRILKQRGKKEIFITENERELMRKELSPILEESDEIGRSCVNIAVCVIGTWGK